MKKILCMMLMLLTVGISGFAQTLGDYVFSTGTDATKWQTLTTTTSLITPGAGDYGVSTVHDIGFAFTYAGEDYTQFSVNADGNLRLGSTVTGTGNYSTPFSATNATVNAPKINMLGCDGFLTDSGHVYHEVIGTAPNRVCVIEIFTSTYSSTSRNSVLRWQVQLFEGSNNIQIVFAPTAPPILPAVTRQMGMSTADGEVFLLNANHQATHYNAGQSTTIAASTWPNVNRYYLFSAPVITCPNVTALTATNLTSNSFDLNWTPVGTETDWDIYVSTSPSYPDSNTVPTDYVSSIPEYTFSSLTANTTYYVFVRANCGAGEVSNWSSLTVTTPCAPNTLLPFTENFDIWPGSTSGSTNNLPYCWSYLNAGTSSTYTGYPIVYASATYAASGSNSLRFYTYTTSGTYDDQMAILPQIDPTLYPINNLQLSFDARNSGTYTFTLVVGVISNPSDKTTFVPVDTIVTTSNTYANYEFPFSQYTGPEGFIAIMAPRPTSSYNAGYVDNIVVDLIPTCPKPKNVASSNATLTSIDLSWTEMGSATNWDIEYGPTGFTQGDGTLETATSNPYTVTGLESSTLYDFYVRANCGGGDLSNYANVYTAGTECSPIATMPFVDDFDSYEGTTGTAATNANLPYCWSSFNVGTSYSGLPNIYGSSTYAASGSNSLRFYTYTTSGTYDDQMVVLPEIDPLSYPVSNLQISFEARNSSTYTFTLVVGVLTDPTDRTTFVPVDTIVTTSNAYQLYEIPFSQYTGTGSHIAMVAPKPASSYNAGYVDNLMVDVIPTCPRPKNLTASNLTLNSIDLAWDEMGTASTWEIEYGPMGFTQGEGAVVSTSSNPYTLNGLEHSTGYDFYVRATCGGNDNSYWSTKLTAATACAPVDNLPFMENFDAYPGSTSTTVNELPYCWSQINTGTTYSGMPNIYASATYAASGNNSLRFYTYSTAAYSDQVAVLPQIDVNSYPINTLQISFDARDNTTSYPFYLIVGVMSNPASLNTFEPVDTIVTSSTSYSNFIVTLDNYTGTGSYVALLAQKPGSLATTYNYGYVDNILLEVIPTCPRPTDFTATSTVIDEVVLSWTDDNASQWDVLYGQHGFDPNVTGEGTLVSGVTNPHTVSGLSEGVVYDFYVRANCGGGDFSSWTLSPATASPYTITMGITGSDTVTGCDFIVTDDGGIVGNYSNNCQYVLVIYPGETDSVVSVSGTFVGETTVDYLSVFDGAGTDEANLLQKIVSGTTGTLINFGPLNSTTGPLTLLFHTDGSVVRDGFVAQVSCVEAPACPKPFDVTISGITNNEATVNWSVMDAASTSFNLVFSTTPYFNPDTSSNVITINTTDYTLTGLNPYTNYYVMVQTDCGGDVSEWTSLVGFRTACDPIVTLPFMENFDSSTGSTTTSVAASNLPYCWSNINEGTSSTYSGYPIIYASATYAASGANSLRFYTYSTTGTYDDQVAVLPLIDPDLFPVNTLQLSLDARRISSSYPFTLVVGVLANPADKATFVPVDTIDVSATTYNHYEIPLNGYMGTGSYIAIMAPRPATSYNEGYVDNILVEVIPNCAKPINFTATGFTDTSVDLEWTEVGDATAWEIVYGPHGFTPSDTSGTVVSVTENPYTLDNLTPSTAYDIYLRSDCGSEYSPFAYDVVMITTACPAIDSLPYVENFDTYGTGTGVYLPCWERINTYSTTTNYPYISTTNYAGVGSLYFYAGTSGTYNIAALQVIDASIPVNTLQANFMWRAPNATSRLEVGVMTNPTDASTFVPVDTIVASATSTWEGFEVSFSQYTGAGQYIAFRVAYNTATGYGYLDNLVVDLIPSCPRPLHVTVSNATTSSIDLSWDQVGSPTSWTIEYGPAGFTPGTGTEVVATTNPFTVTNLSPSTNYSFYVTADCGGGDSSARSFAASGATACAAISNLPYVDNFDGYGTGTTVYPNCWGKINTYSSDRPYVNSVNYAGVGSLYFYGTSGTYNIAITPEFDASIPINTLQATFMYKAVNLNNDRLIVGVMTNPTDATTFVPIDTIYPANPASTWVEQEVVFSNYTGNGHYIAFYNGNPTATCYSYIDNLSIDLISSCPRPQSPHAVNVSTTSVELGWTEVGSATAWEIAYGSVGFDPNSATATVVSASANPFTVQNLTVSSTYEFYVRSLCSATEISPWSAPVTINTLCDAITTLPVTWDFETYDASTMLPVCWNVLNPTSSGPKIMTSYATSGSHSLRLYNNNPISTLILPPVDNSIYPVNGLRVRMYAQNLGTYPAWDVLVTGGVISDPTNSASFVPVDSFHVIGAAGGSALEYTLDMTGYPGVTGQVAIQFRTISTCMWLNVDDLTLEYIGPDTTITFTDPTVATNAANPIAQTTATLHGVITNPDNVTITAKGFEWKATTGGTYTQVSGTGTGNGFTANLTNLTPNTSYTFKAFITFNGQTVYGSEQTFTTLQQGAEPCGVPTGLHSTAVENESITIAWDADSSVNSWNIQYRSVGGALSSATSYTNSYIITGLTGNTDYEIQVQADCGDGNVSDWSSLITVHTTNVGVENYLANNVTLFPNPAKEVVNVQCTMYNVQGIEVFDVYGKLITTTNDIDNPTRIDVSNLADGMYFVRVTTDRGVVTKSFVKR